MNWNRWFLVISGSPENHPKMIAAAGIFVVVWFAMDLFEFVDWAAGKLSPQVTAVCIPVTTGPLPKTDGGLPLFNPANK